MLKPDINYPYPVIRSTAEDYSSTVFKGDMKIESTENGFTVSPSFSINNEDIAALIEEGKLTYAIEVQSPATFYRELFCIRENNPIYLTPGTIHEKVSFTPCVIAATTIQGFANDDFESEYKGMAFNIGVGDVIAIGDSRTVYVQYEGERIKDVRSVVTITNGGFAREISCDFSGSVINVILPVNQYKTYVECGHSKEKYNVLNAVVVIPALVQAIEIIANDERNPDSPSDFASCSWYKSIAANLRLLAKKERKEYQELVEKSYCSAQKLLPNNYAKALEYLSKID